MTKIVADKIIGETFQTEVVVIGGGPAGLSAAGWCTELGLKTVLLERGSDIGGQLHSIYGPIENYLGRRAENGAEMLRHFRESVARFDFVTRLGSEVVSIDMPARSVVLRDGNVIAFGCLIIATGVRRKRLGVPGELEFREKGVIESGMRDKALVTGKKVVIVGGGDAAIENALILSEHASAVTVVHRRQDLRARLDFIDAATRRENIHFLLDTEVAEIEGDDRVRSLIIRNNKSGDHDALPVDLVLMRIGVLPNSELARGQLDLDESGYIVVDHLCRTSAPSVFAAGDVASPLSPTISTATGTATTAAKFISHLFCARPRL